MKYKLLALDIDGTLIGREEVVPAENVAALRAAEAAGFRICLATGRAYVETVHLWRQLGLRVPHEPLILIGGALVSEGDTGRTLYQRTMPMDAAIQFAHVLCDEGYCVVAALDGWRHGLDFVRTIGGVNEPVQVRWLSRAGVRVRTVKRLEDATDMPRPLRVSTVVDPERAQALAATLASQFAGVLNVHSIFVPAYDFTIVEAFSAQATKFASLMYLAQGLRVGPAQIVAVGDEINDLPMIQGAGLGVAMPQAPQVVRDAAKHIANEGLAEFVNALVAGRFD